MREMLTSAWARIQGFLFPMLREEVGPLTPQHERLVAVFDVARIEAFVQMWPGLPGRPPADRHALARAFVAKVVLNLPHNLGAHRAACRRCRAPAFVRLGKPARIAKRKHVLARFRGVRGKQPASARARSAHPENP